MSLRLTVPAPACAPWCTPRAVGPYAQSRSSLRRRSAPLADRKLQPSVSSRRMFELMPHMMVDREHCAALRAARRIKNFELEQSRGVQIDFPKNHGGIEVTKDSVQGRRFV
jgi:hypothetical protein